MKKIVKSEPAQLAAITVVYAVLVSAAVLFA